MMRHKILVAGFLLFCAELLAFAALPCGAGGAEKVKLGYPAFTGAYAPLWIAVAESLGRKHGLDLEAIFSGLNEPWPALGEWRGALHRGKPDLERSSPTRAERRTTSS